MLRVGSCSEREGARILRGGPCWGLLGASRLGKGSRFLHMKTVNWNSGVRWDDPNFYWGEPAYLLEPGDPGYVPPVGAPGGGSLTLTLHLTLTPLHALRRE